MKKPDSKMVELLHDEGKMPDWAYYQLNSKSAAENYIEQREKIMERFDDEEEPSDL